MPVHLLLVNLGTTAAPTPEAVRAFLDEFLSDPAVVDLPRWIWQPILRTMVLRKRPARVAAQYASIWTPEGSPLRVETERIVARVRELARGRCTVSAAYRYGEPSIDQEMARLARERTEGIAVVPLFPQRTDATTGTAFLRARDSAVRAGIGARVRECAIPAEDDGYVRAMAARWREAMANDTGAPEHLVLSYHGIPVRYDRREQGVYVRDCEATTRAILGAIDWPADRATHAYQSKFGPERWLTPSTADVLAELPRRGVRRVAVITPGFVTDGLETIEEIGIRGRESFTEAGGESLLRVAAVADHPAFAASLLRLAAP